ncbi:hypothetical protein ACIHFC_29930, partial [Streptomyces sp. NPDC052013]|uniref:hypothetical protein n=1 Tax=Streptomyces sp. NPDC052013 TaxID=3365679 RepID=UPI0037D3406F
MTSHVAHVTGIGAARGRVSLARACGNAAPQPHTARKHSAPWAWRGRVRRGGDGAVVSARSGRRVNAPASRVDRF